MLSISMRGALRPRTIGAALAAIVAIFILGAIGATSAHAAGCTDSWTNTAGGSWFEGANWSTKAPPKESEEACITAAGTYTVTMAQNSEGVTVKSLTIGGASGTQTLVVASTCNANAKLTTTSGLAIEAHGALTMTKSGGCNNNVRLVGTLTNAGTLTSEGAEGTGRRFLEGSVTNKGTLQVSSSTELAGKGATLTNEGTLNVATGVALFGANETAVVNASGSINGTGSGVVAMEPGSSFTQGGGTTTGSKPVVVRDAALHYTGSGASVIAQHGEGGTLSGNLSSGQSLAIESTCGEHAKSTAAASFSSGGSITLTKMETCNNNARLVIGGGGTLVNTGTITSEAASGTGRRFIEGNLTNKGTLAIDVITEYDATSATLTNEGAIDVAAAQALVVSNKGAVVDGSGGSIVAGAGATVQLEPGTSFTQGAGITSGATPVIVRDAALTYTGAGASSIIQRGESGTLSGNLASVQSLTIESTCGEHAKVTTAEGFTNAGSITLTKVEACNNNARLVIGGGGTLVNTGTITSEAAEGASRRFIEGNLTNKGTLAIDVSTEYDGASDTLLNEGTITLATGAQLLANNKDTVTNAAGAIASTGTGDLFVVGGTYNQGAGKTSGEPVYVDDGGVHFTGTGASAVAIRGTSSLSGEIAKGQTLTIESTCGEHANVSGGAFVNNGTVILTNAEGCGNQANLLLGAGTLENKGPHGGQREIEGSLKNEKTVSIAAGETLKLTGAFTQGKKGTLVTGIASASSFGVLAATGTASIGGTLSLKVAKGFLGSLGQNYGVLSSSALTGTFAKLKSATIKSKTLPGLYYRPTYSSSAVTLVVTQAKVAVAPSEGLAGSKATVTGTGYPAGDVVKLSFVDAKKATTTFTSVTTNASGEFTAEVTLPAGAAEGTGTFTAQSAIAAVKATVTFKVT